MQTTVQNCPHVYMFPVDIDFSFTPVSSSCNGAVKWPLSALPRTRSSWRGAELYLSILYTYFQNLRRRYDSLLYREDCKKLIISISFPQKNVLPSADSVPPTFFNLTSYTSGKSELDFANFLVTVLSEVVLPLYTFFKFQFSQLMSIFHFSGRSR
jgi:hypothetical protein